MKVILIQDVKDLGKKYEIKNVKTGYAKNYLIPNNLARPATEEAMRWLEVQREIIQKKQEDDLKKTQEVVSKIDGMEISFAVKVGDKGQLFESVTAQKIKEALLEESGVEISKSQINLEEPIKETGEFSVKISFDHNLESVVKVIVSEE